MVVNNKKVKTIHSRVKIEEFGSIERSNKVPKTGYNILFIGGDFKRKGGEDVLDVFLTTFSEIAELHLVTYAPNNSVIILLVLSPNYVYK